MMSTIRLNRVSKQFTLRHERSRSFQELFLNMLRLRRSVSREQYWALRDVDFEIEPGEMVGIVGDNGAGKSTLLKLISHIIEPTSGTIDVNGRVSALLELGAGFHPDLTGRENIYLNGSILGFSKAEIHRIFDDIVEFSEMERFIDVPVKHYSSGMYMRLGFSIAIHVRPEILLVDEILAVGDQAFQLRCLDKINEMKRRGITIVLVTHDLETVRKMCSRAIWLDDGVIQAEGAVTHVLETYMARVRAEDVEALQKAESSLQSEGDHTNEEEEESSWRWGSREAEIVSVQFLDGEGKEMRTFKTGQPFVARLHYVAHERIDQPLFGVALHHASGFHINGPNTGLAGYQIEAIEGEGYIDHIIPSLPLLEGTYLFSASLYDTAGQHPYDYHHMAYTFRVAPSEEIKERFGALYIPTRWYLEQASVPEVDELSERVVGP
jgi:ABC-type polysaccharide/polyol phosphate transport system ATPase subunit